MKEVYITIAAAPAGPRDGCKNTRNHQITGKPSVPRKKRRVNWRAIVATLGMTLINAGLWLPTAYRERGYWAVGGEWLLIAAMGAITYWAWKE